MLCPSSRTALLGMDHAGQDFQEGGFPRAIGADQHDALAAFGLEIHAAVNDVLAVGVVDVFEGDDLQAAAPGLRKVEFDGLVARCRGASIFSMRSTCLSLLWAWAALLALARKRSTNSIRWAISRCWFL